MTLEEHLNGVRRRVIEDALLEGTRAYWLRRAEEFEQVGTPAAAATALACRRHAQLVVDLGLDQEATAVLNEVLARRTRVVEVAS